MSFSGTFTIISGIFRDRACLLSIIIQSTVGAQLESGGEHANV